MTLSGKKKIMQKKLYAPVPPDVEKVGKAVLDAAYKVHTALGPGLLESVYETVLAYELEKRALQIVRQMPLPVVYESITFDEGYRADLVVEGKVIVELKSVERLMPVHQKQLLTYLRLTGLRLGFLINFNVPRLKDGIQRIVV